MPAIALAILMFSITAKHCNTAVMYCFQVYVIMATLADRAIPCAYALLEYKRQETYVELLQVLEQCCTQLGVQPDPTVVVTDFESAAMKAVKQVFGSQVETHQQLLRGVEPTI